VVLPEDACWGLTPHSAVQGGLAAESVGVVAGGDEQGRCVVRADAAAGQQGRSVAGDGGSDLLFQLADLVGELTDAPGQ
jgi:hypothetical protein